MTGVASHTGSTVKLCHDGWGGVNALPPSRHRTTGLCDPRGTGSPLVDRPIQRQVFPARVHRLNQLDLPCPLPMLDLFFASDGIGDEIISFEPDEPVAIIPGCETCGIGLRFMFFDTHRKVRRHAEVNRSVVVRRHHVTKAKPTRHRANFEQGDGTVKLCHDGMGRVNVPTFSCHRTTRLCNPRGLRVSHKGSGSA